MAKRVDSVELRRRPSQFEPIPLDGGYGWVVVLGSFLIHVFADGFLFSFGVIANSLIHEFNASNTYVSIILSLLIGLMLGTGSVASISCEKFGCRITTIIGALISFGGCAATYGANSMTYVVISVGVVMGIGVGFMYCAAIIIVTLYFEERRSLATGITVCGAGVGTFMFPKIIALLIAAYDWRTVFLIYSGILLLCIPCGLLFRPLQFRPVNGATTTTTDYGAVVGKDLIEKGVDELKDWRKSSCLSNRIFGDKIQPMMSNRKLSRVSSISGSSSVADLEENPTRRVISIVKSKSSATELPMPPKPSGKWIKFQKAVDFSLLRDPVFWLFTIAIFLGMAGYDAPPMFMPLNAHFVLGLNQSDASTMVSAYGLANIFGRIGFGVLCDLRLPSSFGFGRDCAQNRLVIYSVAMVLCGLASCAVFLFKTAALFLVYCVFFGFMISSFMCLWSVILVDIVGFPRLTNAFSLLLFVQGIATFVGTPTSGKLYDLTDSYDWTFGFCGVVQLLSGFLMFSILPIQILRRKNLLIKRQTSSCTTTTASRK